MQYKIIFLILLGVLLHFPPVSAQKNSIQNDSIQKQISIIENGLISKIQLDSINTSIYSLKERMELYKVLGVSIAVFKGRKILWSKGYGLADIHKMEPVNTKTMFQAASISKAVTALAVMKLSAQKGLNLDSDINNYLTDWKISENEFTQKEKVTIRRLLNHSAGISVSGFTGYKKTDTIPSTTDILNGKGNSPKISVISIPGEKFSYSGGGYIVLMKLIEDISKMPFQDFVKKEILLPLKMTSSTFNQLPKGNHSLAYNNYGKAYDGGWFIMPELAAAGLWTTPSDLSKFCLAIQNAYNGGTGAIISQQQAKDMLTPTNNWGLGFGIRGQGDAAFFFHGGKNQGFNNIIIDIFNQDLGIVVMTNGEQGGTLRDEIVRSFAKFYNVKVQPPPRIVKPVELNKREVTEFLGKYQWKENYFLELSIDENDNIILKDLFDGKVNIFVPLSSNSFIDKNTGEEAILKKDLGTGVVSIFYNNIDTFIKVK